MSPIGKPARETLKPAGETTIAWAVFDARWYLASYPQVRDEIGDADDAAALAFYLEKGQQQGHSPNLWFDEIWHMRRYPGAATSVREGHAQSGFDAYCRAGFRIRSPHWLFSEPLYRQLHSDIGDDELARDGHANGYDHYLKHGGKQSRIGHYLFDPVFYDAQLDAAGRIEVAAQGPFQHYLRHAYAGGPEHRTCVYFDPSWYLHHYPEAAEAIAARGWLCALHHYLCNDTPGAFDPLAEFSDRYYLASNPDVLAAVESGSLRNGYEHFLGNGATELRAPNQWINLRYYVNAHPAVRADLQSGRMRDAFAHYLTIGRAQGLAPAPLPEERVTEQQASALFRRKAADLLPMAGRLQVDFTCTGVPALSVVMLLRGGLAETVLALGRLRANFQGDIELILVDCGDDSVSRPAARYAVGAVRLPFDSDIGVARSHNAALQCATADAVLFLSNQVELAPGTIAAALPTLHSDQRIGAVGGKVIRGDGNLLQAGGIVWRDGVIQGYLRDGSPLAPEANFVRDVDYCSEAFLLLRGAVVRDLDGFDEELGATGFSAADLCIRLTTAGLRVMYNPSAVVHFHGDGVTVPEEAATYRAQQHFLRKHRSHLRFRYAADRRVEVFARYSSTASRVLFIDDTIPLRHLGSGFVRSNDIIRALASLGFSITVFPLVASDVDLPTIYADMPDTAEVMHDRTIDNLAELLAARQGYYDVIWIVRTHNLDRIRPILERVTSGSGRPPRVVLDTEAIASLREAERAMLLRDEQFDLAAAITHEFANAHFCQSIVAINAAEARKLSDLGFSDVAVIGHRRELNPTPRAFSDRAGLLYLGAIHQTDSPNYDAVTWFIREVLPLIERELGWETRLTVAGYTDPSVSLGEFEAHPRVTLRGTVTNIEALYNTHRIFVAPTRYAAGMPYKLHEAASFGIPIVTTELLRRQLGWESGRDLLSAEATDPAALAAHVVTLYQDARALADPARQRVGKGACRERPSRL